MQRLICAFLIVCSALSISGRGSGEVTQEEYDRRQMATNY